MAEILLNHFGDGAYRAWSRRASGGVTSEIADGTRAMVRRAGVPFGATERNPAEPPSRFNFVISLTSEPVIGVAPTHYWPTPDPIGGGPKAYLEVHRSLAKGFARDLGIAIPPAQKRGSFREHTIDIGGPAVFEEPMEPFTFRGRCLAEWEWQDPELTDEYTHKYYLYELPKGGYRVLYTNENAGGEDERFALFTDGVQATEVRAMGILSDALDHSMYHEEAVIYWSRGVAHPEGLELTWKEVEARFPEIAEAVCSPPTAPVPETTA